MNNDTPAKTLAYLQAKLGICDGCSIELLIRYIDLIFSSDGYEELKSDPQFQNALGLAYAFDFFLFDDRAKGIRLLEMAAAKNFGKAYGNLGICYRNGQGVARDLEKAAEYFRLATRYGDDRRSDLRGVEERLRSLNVASAAGRKQTAPHTK